MNNKGMDLQGLVLFVTTSTADEANEISDLLLEKRKAACVNVVNQVESHFWWKGNIEAEKEYLLVIKTKLSVLDDVVSLVKQAHSYEVPEVIAIPIIGGNDDYLKWLDEEVEG